ncbi:MULTISPECIES: type II secretion system protein GspN [Geobacter]|uniref:type II secretion system protein GspN n=1 Tax=Geobacter TaxID=28231 RepID=UPI002572F174|nr:type II secretion system protein GspN [Geobacter sulfurreducens]BEH08658.1 type II secretion system protein GspN [Geobacter sulfurreducens subsp. ethanolicus]BET60146.1 type II secretion system protein GspN [Geobacter sp. 60473]
MTAQRWLAWGVGIIAGLLLILIFTLLLVPSRELEQLTVRWFARQGYDFSAADFGKAFPLGIAARGVTIADNRGPLLRVDTVRARLELLPLLAGKVSVDVDGSVGAGQFDGTFRPRAGTGVFSARDVRLEDIPFFRTATDADIKGVLTVDATLAGTGRSRGGDVKLAVKGAHIRGATISGVPLPDAVYETVRGMVRVAGGRATIDSFSLQGEDVYVRLSGTMPLMAPMGNSPLNLSLELMPRPAFLDRQKLVFTLLAKYLVTPGHYRLPIRGTLSKPLLQ